MGKLVFKICYVILRGDLFELLRDKSLVLSKKHLLDILSQLKQRSQYSKFSLVINLLYLSSIDFRFSPEIGKLIVSLIFKKIKNNHIYEVLKEYYSMPRTISFLIRNTDFKRHHKVSRLIILYDYLGMFCTSLEIRQKLNNSIMISRSHKFKMLHLKYNVSLIENNDLDSAYLILSDIILSPFKQIAGFYIEDFVTLTSCPLKQVSTNLNPIDRADILLVSPGYLDSTLSHFQAKYNLVVTYNNYNVEELNRFNKRLIFLNNSFPKSKDFLSFQVRNSFFVYKRPSRTYNLRGLNRVSFYRKIPWIYGHPNLVQFSLYDFIHFSYNKIHIIGLNFFLAKFQHNENYVNKNSKDKILRDLVSHNQFSNLFFIRLLLKTKRIEVDAELYRLLNLENHKLASLMGEFYV